MTKTSDDIMQEALDKYVVNTDHADMRIAFYKFAIVLQKEISQDLDKQYSNLKSACTK